MEELSKLREEIGALRLEKDRLLSSAPADGPHTTSPYQHSDPSMSALTEPEQPVG